MLPTDYNPNDPYGVRLDSLVDARIQMEGAEQTLNRMYVELDTIADSVELWDDDAHRELRAAQDYIESLQDRVADALDHVEDELDTIRANE